MYERLERHSRATQQFAERYAHTSALVAFICGFLFDVYTLVRVDRWFEQVSFGFYMTLVTVLCVVISWHEHRKAIGSDGLGGKLLSPVWYAALQFGNGALLGGFLILYGRSGTLEGSIFFLSGIAMLLLGNELFRARYTRVLFRFSVWFVLSIMYITLMLPLVYGRLGFDVFQHGLLTAILCGFAMLLFFRTQNIIPSARDFLLGCLTSTLIVALFWVSYYSQSIPPVPLSLQSALIAHEVVREGDVYRVTYEPNTSLLTRFFRESSATFHAQSSLDTYASGTRLYCFSQVYAPATLTSPLRHRWERVDTKNGEWIEVARIPFSIVGGRENGYRAYSYITLKEGDTDAGFGRYRCAIETGEGFLVGRRTVDVVWGEGELLSRIF